MSNNVRYMTAGESHGPYLTVIVDGLPAGISISEDLIRNDLSRRQEALGAGGRMSIETDKAVISSLYIMLYHLFWMLPVFIISKFLA